MNAPANHRTRAILGGPGVHVHVDGASVEKRDAPHHVEGNLCTISNGVLPLDERHLLYVLQFVVLGLTDERTSSMTPA
jgi:hypothetical protein